MCAEDLGACVARRFFNFFASRFNVLACAFDCVATCCHEGHQAKSGDEKWVLFHWDNPLWLRITDNVRGEPGFQKLFQEPIGTYPRFFFNGAWPYNTLIRRSIMLGWALTFFVLAIIAAVFGFGGIAGASAGIAQILFFIFLALLVLSFVARAVRGRSVL